MTVLSVFSGYLQGEEIPLLSDVVAQKLENLNKNNRTKNFVILCMHIWVCDICICD